MVKSEYVRRDEVAELHHKHYREQSLHNHGTSGFVPETCCSHDRKKEIGQQDPEACLEQQVETIRDILRLIIL